MISILMTILITILIFIVVNYFIYKDKKKVLLDILLVIVLVYLPKIMITRAAINEYRPDISFPLSIKYGLIYLALIVILLILFIIISVIRKNPTIILLGIILFVGPHYFIMEFKESAIQIDNKIYLAQNQNLRELLEDLKYGNLGDAAEILKETSLEELAEYDLNGSTILINSIISPHEPLYGKETFDDYNDFTRMLIAKGVDVNQASKGGCYPLEKAIYEENEEIANLLINKGADVNHEYKDDYSLLSKVIDDGMYNTAELMIKNGVEINKSDIGFTELMSAARANQVKIMELLIAKGAKVNSRTDSGCDPLYYSLINHKKDNDATEYLLENGARLDVKYRYNSETPLMVALDYRNKKASKLLLEKGVSISEQNSKGKSVLEYALENNDYYVVNFIVEKQNIDLSGYTKYLSDICTNNNNEKILANNLRILDLFLKESLGQQLLNKALIEASDEKGGMEIVKKLVKNGADVNFIDKNGDSALTEACYYGNKEIVYYLLDKGAEVREKDLYVSTGRGNDIEVFKSLYKINPIISDRMLEPSILRRREDLSIFLLENGTDPNAELYNACQHGKYKTVKKMLELGAVVDNKNSYYEETPLIGALHSYDGSERYYKVIKVLLEYGADINAVDGYGNKAKDIIKNDKKLEKLFRDYI